MLKQKVISIFKLQVLTATAFIIVGGLGLWFYGIPSDESNKALVLEVFIVGCITLYLLIPSYIIFRVQDDEAELIKQLEEKLDKVIELLQKQDNSSPLPESIPLTEITPD